MNAAPSHILVLEDDMTLQKLIRNYCREHFPEVEILFARSIHEGQVLLSHYEAKFFIVDVNLPDGNGLDFICDVKTVDPEAKFMVMTAAPLSSVRDKAHELGTLQFLEKPFDLNVLTEIFRAVMQGDVAIAGQNFHGTLRQLLLTDIMQIKCMSGASCVLQIVNPHKERGIIHIHDGEIVHACAGALEGVEAFNQIICWKGGMFAELEAVPLPERTIFERWQALMMEAVRLADEAEDPGIGHAA